MKIKQTFYSLIKRKPKLYVYNLKRKELAYFFHFMLGEMNPKAISNYRQAFAAPKGAICGEWSPSYLWFPFAIESLYKSAPETKILVMLRNPVDRYLSHYNQSLIGLNNQFRDNADMHNLTNKLWAYPDSIYQGLVSSHLEKLLTYFSHDQILMLQYEKCRENTLEEISKTYRFLGIDDSYVPSEPDRPVNKKKYVLEGLTLDQRKKLADF